LGLAISGQYRHVDIYTYSHTDSLSAYISGAGDLAQGDVLLGGVPAPDAESWRIDAEVFLRANLGVSAGVFGARIGEGRDVQPFEPGDDENPPFPSGVVDKTLGVNVGAQYEFAGDSWVAVTYAHALATNRGNVAGDDPVTDAFRLEIRWDIP
jgi:predicted porin